jgi:uncharacterized lipoprotein YajG
MKYITPVILLFLAGCAATHDESRYSNAATTEIQQASQNASAIDGKATVIAAWLATH